MVGEVLSLKNGKYKAVKLLGLKSFFEKNRKYSEMFDSQEISERELKKISSLKSPNQVILELEMPDPEKDVKSLENQFSVYLEDIRDPGNMGTIIRTADWFGVQSVLCTENSVDLYNPKVLQASMGSFARVNLIRIDPESLFKEIDRWKIFPLIATQMTGENIYTTKLPDKGILFFGNESMGLSETILAKCHKKISIPSQSPDSRPESLNLSISVGIFLSERAGRLIRNEN